jgi:hypothetical protein
MRIRVRGCDGPPPRAAGTARVSFPFSFELGARTGIGPVVALPVCPAVKSSPCMLTPGTVCEPLAPSFRLGPNEAPV